MMSTTGAILGSLAGVALLPTNSLDEVYNGLWGYSAILSTSAITCVFFAFNKMSVLLGMVNLLGTIGIQYGLRQTMHLQVSFHYLNAFSTSFPICISE